MKISLRRIIDDHFDSYRHPKSKRLSWPSILGAYGLPLLVAFLVAWRRYEPPGDLLTGILTAFSIFFGLLFNLLVFNLDFLDRPEAKASDDKSKIRHRMIEQTHANISYATLVALATVLVALVTFTTPGWTVPESWQGIDDLSLTHILSGLLAGIALHFVLTGMGVLRRVYAISKDIVDGSA